MTQHLEILEGNSRLHCPLRHGLSYGAIASSPSCPPWLRPLTESYWFELLTTTNLDHGPLQRTWKLSPTVVLCQTQSPTWLRSSLRLNCGAVGTSHLADMCSLPARHVCAPSSPAQDCRLLAFVLKVLPRARWSSLPGSNLGSARESYGTPGSFPVLCAPALCYATG